MTTTTATTTTKVKKKSPTKTIKIKAKSTYAALTIGRFMHKTGVKRRVRYLNKICSDAGECIAFGTAIGTMKKLFESFHLKYAVTKQMKKIGAKSANGSVVEVPFHRKGYTMYAVLKSALSYEADNLFYEAFVGTFINKWSPKYPCFVETYASLTYTVDEDVDVLDLERLEDGLTQHKVVYSTFLNDDSLVQKSCRESQNFAVLTQHIKQAQTLFHEMFQTSNSMNLVNYLYQVYCPLSALANRFTHYDLHVENVLIYRPKHYITMTYTYPDGSVVWFHTPGIAKIIDYGRSFFDDDEVSSKLFDEKLRQECEEDDIADSYKNMKDIRWATGHTYSPRARWGRSIQRNKSHDLRLLRDVRNEHDIRNKQMLPILSDLCDSVKYYGSYGTGEMAPTTFKTSGDPIRNVEDAHRALKEILQSPAFISAHAAEFSGKPRLGEMRVWVDGSRPVEFDYDDK